MNKQIDTRGLSCPQPVVLVAREIQSGTATFEVLLDSDVAQENVRRLLESRGFTIDRNETDDGVVFSVCK